MLKWILFDLNSFFASCEQQENPHYRGRPLAVVPSLTNTTSVIAASYEAKKMGIKTNTRVSDAKKMCPGLILVSGNHRLYTEYHHRIIAACEEILPVKKVLSIDEMAFELLGKERNLPQALEIAQNMKDHVRKKVGLQITSSVGIGPNILIAKIASDMQKPDGLVSIKINEIPEKLGPLPIEAIPGVGRKMKVKLNAKGYFVISDFLKATDQQLRKHWGNIWGLRIARELKGEDLRFRNEKPKQSISHQHVLPPDLRNWDKSYQVMIRLLMKALVRLRKEKLKSRSLSIYIKCVNEERLENRIGYTESDDSFFHIEQVKKLWNDLQLKPYLKPIKLAVTLGDLIAENTQLSFFDNPRNQNINQALDLINNRFGANTLYIASTQPVLGSAKTRISFNHIPDLSEEFDLGDKK